MDVNYGTAVKEYLLNSVTLLRIHRFDPLDVQFEDALVSSAVVWFKNAPPSSDHTVEFTYGKTLAEPNVTAVIPLDVLRNENKWTKFPAKSQVKVHPPSTLTISDIFDVKRGLATGNNKYFILMPEQVENYGLPSEFLTPILPSPRYLTSDIITGDTTGDPIIDPKLFLLSCNRSESEVRLRFPSLWAYLEKGKADGIDTSHLCAHRNPWYSQEKRPAAPLLCTYMGRQNSRGGRPFRFILNQSRATAANVYLMMYPKPPLASLLNNNPQMLDQLWRALNDIPIDTLISEGRVYGGGLNKLEPKELGNALADSLLPSLPGLQTQLTHQPRLFKETRVTYAAG